MAEIEYYARTFVLKDKKKSDPTFKKLYDFLEEQKKQEKIATYHFYTKKITVEAEKEQKNWNALLLLELKQRTVIAEIVDFFANTRMEEVCVKEEILHITPRSNSKNMLSKKQIQLIEFVQVMPQHIKQFKSMMTEQNGPVMEDIIFNKKWCGEFLGLETAESLSHNQEYPDWNQIHLIRITPMGIFSYKKDFGEALKKYTEASFQQHFSYLKKIRKMELKIIAKKWW